MSQTPPRYYLSVYGDNIEQIEHPEGDWMEVAEHDRIMAEKDARIAEMEAQCEAMADMLQPAEPGLLKRHLAERKARDDAATARREAFEEAAMCCDDEADKCDDAVKWGGAQKYIAACKAAAYAMRDRASAIRALAEKG